MKLNKLYLIFFFVFFTFNVFAQNYSIKIIGNKYIDKEIIQSLISEFPNDISNIDKGLIIEQLNNTGYFKDIEILSLDNVLNIKLKEYPLIKEVNFKKNKRFKEEDLLKIYQDNNEYNIYNEVNISKTIDQFYNLYKSFGYHSIDIQYNANENSNNEINLDFIVSEGKISKIKNIIFNGNEIYSKNTLLNQIKSKERNYFSFIFNANFKTPVLQEDLIRLINFYQNNGFRNVKIDMQYEFISSSNYFNVYFNIDEGEKFFLKEVNINNESNILTENQFNDLKLLIDNSFGKKIKNNDLIYNEEFLLSLKNKLANYIFKDGLYFFEILLLEKVQNDNVYVLFDVKSIEPTYAKSIEIYGNSRTKDRVIRRELSFAEGDAVNNIIIGKSRKQIKKLDIFSEVDIEKNDDGSILVKVKEKSTGTFQFGVGFNSYDGATFIAELRERNFQGSGRKVNFTFNNATDTSQYKLGIVEPHIFNKDLNLIYNISYSEYNLSKSSSYKYDDLNTEIGLDYDLSEKLYHTITLGYSVKDYSITNREKASYSVRKLGGSNAQFLLNNIITYNNLDSLVKPTNGNYLRFYNVVSPVTNSTDGFVKNTINLKQYYSRKNNIYSIQSLLGNISSLQNETIDDSDKFSLGGRWLRGFDHRGVGPRDSRTSYTGGNNLAVAKFDLLRPIDRFSDNPIYLNLFTDVGKIWSNKVTPTHNNENVRSSYGFGLNYYSPIGPIGFSWGFPINDEPEDIKRMFTFTVGYLN